MNIKENQAAQDELIKEVLSLRMAYGISEFDFGVVLLAMGSAMMKKTGETKDGICEMIRGGL